MAVQIRLRRGTATQWTTANPVLAVGEAGYETDTRKLKVGDGSTAWSSLPYFIGDLPGATLNDLGDVTITSAANGDFLRWNGTAWINDAVNLSTDTVGDYVTSLVAGTGVTVTNNSGEGATPTVAIGQAVATSSSVTFAQVTAPLAGNADTASTLQNARTISLSGDVSGSVSFNGSTNVDIAATIQPNSVALGTDTTGNYVNNVVSGTGVTVSHTPGEGSTASISIGQPVATSSSVTFAAVTAPLIGNANTASTLQTARTISLSGDVSGSVSFNGSANVDIAATIQPNSVALGTDTTGNYVNDVVAGTGVTVTHTPGEGSSASIAIGQPVATSSSVTFAAVTAPLIGNADTASTLQNARTISLSGDVSGSVSFNGSTNVDITTTVQPNSVALGSDTTGNYMSDAVGGTGVTVTHTPGEGSSASIAIGQDVATNASVSFAQVSTTGDVTVGGNLTVNGTTTTLNTETLAVEDNIVLLNSNVTGSPSTNAGIEVERGDSANVVLRWNESTDSWEVTEDGSTYKNIAVGQDVETSSSVTFAAVTASTFTGSLIGNADTASQLATARTIALSGDVTGSVSFNGSGSVDIATTIQPNSVALGTDTTGNYMTDVAAGTGIAITHTPGEGSTASIALNAWLNDLGDVVIVGSPEKFQTLGYDGAGWVNSYAPVVSYVRNVEATTLTVGTVVYLFGGTGDHASVKRADNSSDTTSSKTVGIVGANIAASENGPVVTRGYVSGMDLSAYSAGDVLWLGENGTFTTTKPTAPKHLVFVGVVVRATNNGIIYVATQNGYELEELHDVKISSPQNNDFLKYSSASAIWVNDPINLGTDTVGNYMTDVVAGSNNIVITHTPGEGSSASINLADNVTAQAVGVGTTILGEGYVSWLGSTDSPGRLRWNPSALRDIYLPDAGGTVAITSASTGIVALGTDTTGNYMADVVAGTNISITHTPGEASSASIAVVGNPTFSGTASAADFRSSTFLVQPNGYVGWLSPADAYGRIYWSPSTTRTIYLPDVSGSIVTTGDNGTVTSTMIANGTITNSDISEAANIGLLKLQNAGVGGQLIVTDASGVPTYQTITGDISVNASGVASIQANSVALGTDTTGDYVASLVAGTGITLSNNSGESASPTIAIGQDVATSSSVTFAQVTSSVVTILGTPSNSTDAVTKQYVDQVAAGIDWHTAVALTTAAALPNTPTYDNGSSGSGATLTAGANARLVIDGTNATTGTRVLVKDQANAVHNGVYDVTEQGSVSIPWVLTRAEDFDGDTGHEIYGGEAVFTAGGTNNIRQGFTVTSAGSGTAGAHEFGTDSLTFTQFTGTAAFTAGSGLTQSGNSIDVATASSTRIVVNSDSIDLATVNQTNTSGTAGTSFVQSHTVDSYGRITGTVTADVQDASTSAKGIARFDSSHFSVSSGSVSIQDASTSSKGIASFNSGQFSVTSGSVSIKSGGITSTEIANGTIVNSDVSETAGIALMKLQYGTSGQMIVAASDGMPTWQTITGDISVNASGVATIAANSVALGTDTTGNYLVNVVAQPGLVITHTPGEGSTASIGLDSVIASSNSGASGTNFISAITVDGYGRVTSYTASDVQDASTSAKGIAQFNSSHFSVSSGSVSLPQSVATTASPTFGGLTISGTASVASSASINGQLNAASTTIRLKGTSNQSLIAMNANTSSSADVFKIVNNYNIGDSSNNTVILMRDSTDMSTRAGLLFRQTSTNAGIEVGPRLLIDSVSMLDSPSSLTELAAASVVFYVDRHTSGSVGIVLKDAASSNTSLLEWRNSSGSVFGAIGGNNIGYRFDALSASLNSASIGTASISTASVSGNLTVGGNLTINGTTTTVNSTTITVDDPIFTLGGDTAPTSDDNKDRGIEFRYHSGTAASVGFMGYDDSTGRFTFLTGATNTAEVFSGTNASVEVGPLISTTASGNIGTLVRDSVNNATLFSITDPGAVWGSSSTSFRINTGIGATYLESQFANTGYQYIALYGQSLAGMQFGSNDGFTFQTSKAASVQTTFSIQTSSVAILSSASVTLPSKTFFPEEYLSVSSSVTLNSTTHRYATLEMTASAGTSVITVPADASDNFAVGSVIQIIRVGAGEVQVTASAGVTVNNALGSRLRAQWSTATLRKRAANTWLLSGDLKV